MKYNIKAFVIGFLICLAMAGVTVTAVTLNSTTIGYNNSKTGFKSTDVKGAIDELYSMLENNCPEGLTCKLDVCNFDIGQSWEFEYRGTSEEFTAPCKGLYQLEVWGADSLDSYSAVGGKGGYANGYIEFSKNEKIYVVVGGRGAQEWKDQSSVAGGYNGGGSSIATGAWISGGGGATHMARVDGQLKEIGYTEFVTNKKGLIVAGGAGAAAGNANWGAYSNGGDGGGLTGGSGRLVGNTAGAGAGGGGTQTSGGVCIASRLGDYGQSGSFGQGGNSGTQHGGGGGGGGLYGGSGSVITANWGEYASAGGGSSYIGGVPTITYKGVTYSPSTLAGQWTGAGKAKITLIAY